MVLHGCWSMAPIQAFHTNFVSVCVYLARISAFNQRRPEEEQLVVAQDNQNQLEPLFLVAVPARSFRGLVCCWLHAGSVSWRVLSWFSRSSSLVPGQRNGRTWVRLRARFDFNNGWWLFAANLTEILQFVWTAACDWSPHVNYVFGNRAAATCRRPRGCWPCGGKKPRPDMKIY